MPAPCAKCGATKTDPTRHGLRHTLARLCGYELRECARCRRFRMLPRRPPSPAQSPLPEGDSPSAAAAGPTGLTRDAAGEAPGAAPGNPRYRGTPYGNPGAFDPDGFSGCPVCGSMKYTRSRRRWLERVMRRPPMARCEHCACRFPVPQA